MELREKIGEGAGSEVYACGTNDAVKLFTAGTPRETVEYEARVTSVAHEAGAPAPEVRGLVELEGRYGIIFPRYHGETLLHLALRGAMTPSEVGRVMAVTQHSLHDGQFHVRVRTFREWVLSEIPSLKALKIPGDVVKSTTRTLMALPQSGILCHGDLHPGNILITSGGSPVIIDWISAIDANPLVDVARQHVTLTMMRFANAWASQLRSAHDSFITTYAGLASEPPARLLTAITPYVSVMAAMRMVESQSDESEREALIAYVRSQA